MDYKSYWDKQYLSEYYIQKGKSLWDVSPALSIEEDYQKLGGELDHTIPIMDLGCGVGNQSHYLTAYFSQVIGTDISSRAIKVAQKKYNSTGLDFMCLNLLELKQVEDFIEKYGPCNIYMRGVFHQIEEEDKKQFLKAIGQILGNQGKILFNEVSEDVRKFKEDEEEALRIKNTKLEKVFSVSISSLGLSISKLKEHLPNDFVIGHTEKSFLRTNLIDNQGVPVKVPSIRGIFFFEGNTT